MGIPIGLVSRIGTPVTLPISLKGREERARFGVDSLGGATWWVGDAKQVGI